MNPYFLPASERKLTYDKHFNVQDKLLEKATHTH